MPTNTTKTINKMGWTPLTDTADSPVVIAFHDATNTPRVHLYPAAAAPADDTPIDTGATIIMGMGRTEWIYPQGLNQAGGTDTLYAKLDSGELMDEIKLVVQE